MSRDLIPPGPIGPRELVEAWLRARSPNTVSAYRQDLLDFSRFLGVDSLDKAAAQLLGRGHGPANAVALNYKHHMMQRNLSGATICRRLAALRSLVKLARILAIVPWALEVENVSSEPYRDTTGPGVHGVQALVDAIQRRGGPLWLRDQLAVILMFDLALRRGEVVRLDLADVDLKENLLWVMRKRRRARVKVAFPKPTRETILDWVKVRGRDPGPLLISAKGQRLTGNGLWDIVKRAGRAAGIEVRVHGLRHSSVTAALDQGCDLRAVSRFAGHASLAVTSLYDDKRKNDARDVAAQVAGLVTRHRPHGQGETK